MYKIDNDPQMLGQKILIRNSNDKAVNCPFHTPMQVPSPFNPREVSLMYRPCGTWCALFELADLKVRQNCSTVGVIHVQLSETNTENNTDDLFSKQRGDNIDFKKEK